MHARPVRLNTAIAWLFMIGSATGETQINGGDLLQANSRAIQVSGLVQLKFVAGHRIGPLLRSRHRSGVTRQCSVASGRRGER